MGLAARLGRMWKKKGENRAREASEKKDLVRHFPARRVSGKRVRVCPRITREKADQNENFLVMASRSTTAPH